MNNNILECRSLCKTYHKTEALSDVSFTLERGRIIGLLGPNGSGKTTLIKIANGLLTPTSGEMFIDGNKPGVYTRRKVSYLPDTMALPDWMKVEQLIGFYKDFYPDFNEEKAAEMVKNLGIDKSAHLKELSKGTKEKVQLILVMSREADLYLLDEPMGGVDPATRDYILNTIIANYNENSTVLISTHLISDVEKILDEVLFIDKGKILLQSSVDSIREEKHKSVDELFREVFRC